MRYKIHFILIIISAIIAIVGGILVLVGFHGKTNTPYLYGGLAALVNAAILYGYAYIVKACVIYSEKFSVEYSKEDPDDKPKKDDE